MTDKKTTINHWATMIVDESKEISSTQLIEIISQAESTGKDLFFRGESKNYIEHKDGQNIDTRLLPSVFRGAEEKKNYYDALTNFPQEFADLSSLSKLAKMQHYNYPTRLLDLTTNPLVALWFACSDYSRYRKIIRQEEREDGYFYIISTQTENILTCDSDKALLLSCLSRLHDTKERPHLQKLLLDVAMEGCFGMDERRIIDNKYIEKLKAKNEDNQEVIAFEKLIGEAIREKAAFSTYRTNPLHLFSSYIVRPMIQNERQRKQDGLFAIFGLQCNIKEYTNNKDFTIKRYKVPQEKKITIIRQLDKLGINEATLFEDLESRASHNRSKEESFRKQTGK